MTLLRPAVYLTASLLLTQCGSKALTPQGQNLVAAPGVVLPAAPVVKQLMIPQKQTEAFDRFLHDALSPIELTDLKTSCNLRPEEDIFCYAVLNRESLEARNLKAASTPALRGPSVTRPRFAHHQLRNWNQLREASVNSLIRGLAGIKAGNLERLAHLSETETNCPNNIAIAVAAQKEEALPDRTTPARIASLYKKGADCITKNPADRETLLTRAGLFYFLGHQYKEAEETLKTAAAEKDIFVGRALYWLYRAQNELKNTAGANSTLTELKTRYPFSFHSLVALSAEDQDPGKILKKMGINKLTRSQKNPEVNSLIESVEALEQYGYQESATKVLDWTIAQTQESEPELRIYLAGLRPDELDYKSRITILSDVLYKNPDLVSKQTMDLYFPKAYFPVFEQNTSGIDPYLLLSVARQESAFNPHAVSSANARGLLQLDPKTGRRYQHHPPPNLMDPKTNISIASRYLFDLLKRTNGQIYYALAAYNAGENRLTTWMIRYPTNEPILFIDLIPYHETRDYVASVLRNYYWYRRIDLADSETPPKPIFQVDLTSIK